MRPDIELYGIAHRAMELEAAELAGLTGRLADAGVRYSSRQARGLRTFVRVLVGDLKRHHIAEDEVGWPILASASPGVDLSALSDDHAALDPVLTALLAAADGLATDPSETAVRADLAAAAGALADILPRHIAEEERIIFPLIVEHVSVAEFTRWEKAADRGIPLRDLRLLIPSSVRVVAPGDRARVLAKTPPLFRIALRLFGRSYARRHRLVFG